jgi:hypothetical protein
MGHFDLEQYMLPGLIALDVKGQQDFSSTI